MSLIKTEGEFEDRSIEEFVVEHEVGKETFEGFLERTSLAVSLFTSDTQTVEQTVWHQLGESALRLLIDNNDNATKWKRSVADCLIVLGEELAVNLAENPDPKVLTDQLERWNPELYDYDKIPNAQQMTAMFAPLSEKERVEKRNKYLARCPRLFDFMVGDQAVKAHNDKARRRARRNVHNALRVFKPMAKSEIFWRSVEAIRLGIDMALSCSEAVNEGTDVYSPY